MEKFFLGKKILQISVIYSVFFQSFDTVVIEKHRLFQWRLRPLLPQIDKNLEEVGLNKCKQNHSKRKFQGILAAILRLLFCIGFILLVLLNYIHLMTQEEWSLIVIRSVCRHYFFDTLR